MSATIEQYRGVGRRKTSVARVYLRPGKGEWVVNGRSLEVYFPGMRQQQHLREPLVFTQKDGSFDVKVNVEGGGLAGQSGAIRLGIARALVQLDEDLRKPLREAGMLTRDPREVERKKPGRPGARKRFQFSKR
jgi:small subunit ribosomal protein S9